MKKILSILVLWAAAATVSCGEDLLDTQSPSTTDSPFIFSNRTYAEAAIMNIYRQFSIDKSYRNRWFTYYGVNNDTEWSVGMSPDKPNETKALIYTYNAEYDNSSSELNQANGLFSIIYSAIENCNLAITGLREHGNVKEDEQMRYLLGEALVLRSFFYFDLIKAWGDVPARFRPIGETGDVLKAKSDRDEIYRQIIADLEEAAGYVYWPNESGVTQLTTRVNKAFAYGLLARVCLSAAGYSQRPDEGQIGTGNIGSNRLSKLVEAGQEWGDKALYKKALAACKEVIAKENTCVGLEKEYENLWRGMMKFENVQAGGETLFVIPFAEGRGRWMTTYAVKHSNGDKYVDANRGGTIGPVPSMFYEYEKSDQRRDITCVNFFWKGGKQIVGTKDGGMMKWYCGKYRYEWMNKAVEGTDCGVKPIVMRYADILLMAAEAANELDDLAYAKTQLRKVRFRAYKSNEKVDAYLDAINSKDGMFNAIFKERALEFCCEQIRKQDLIRWGLLKEALDDTKGKMQALLDHSSYTSVITDETYDYSALGTQVYYRYLSDGESIEIYGLDRGEAGKPDDVASWTLATVGESGSTDYIKGGDTQTARINMIYQFDPNQHMFWPLFKQDITPNALLRNDYGYPSN